MHADTAWGLIGTMSATISIIIAYALYRLSENSKRRSDRALEEKERRDQQRELRRLDRPGRQRISSEVTSSWNVRRASYTFVFLSE
jgi:hypothetical protein